MPSQSCRRQQARARRGALTRAQAAGITGASRARIAVTTIVITRPASKGRPAAMTPTPQAPMAMCACTARAARPARCASWAGPADPRHGLIASAMVTIAEGHAEREASKVMPDAACEAAGEDVIHSTVGAGPSRQGIHRRLPGSGGHPACGASHPGRLSAVPGTVAQSVGHALSRQRGSLIEQRLWLGHDGPAHAPGDAARLQARGPPVRADDGSRQLDAHARLGANPPAAGVSGKN